MRELIVHVENDDSDTAAALRIIAHFDGLTEATATAGAVVRAAAKFAGCCAGIHDAERELTKRFGPTGESLVAGAVPRNRGASVPNRAGSIVWLERTGPPAPLDGLIEERAARAVGALLGPAGPPSAESALRIVFDSESPDAERADAARSMGLAGDFTVSVVLSGWLDNSALRRFTSGSETVLLFRGRVEPPSDARSGQSTADCPLDLAAALERARTAVRFTDRLDGPGPSTVSHESLGALAAVAQSITISEARDVSDVSTIHSMLAGRPWAVDTLQAVLDSTSVRQAAVTLHLHHSTLTQRISQVTASLGFDPTHGIGRHRAVTALLLWRLAHYDE